LAALLAAARRVLAALAADPSALDGGGGGGAEGGGDGNPVDADAGPAASTSPSSKSPAFQAALSSAAADFGVSLAGLRAALTELAAAESDAQAGLRGKPSDATARTKAAAALEAEVEGLRARVDAGNAGALDVAARLAALVEDLDAWRVHGMAKWTGTGGGGSGVQGEKR
jgi:hypothetical protein